MYVTCVNHKWKCIWAKLNAKNILGFTHHTRHAQQKKVPFSHGWGECSECGLIKSCVTITSTWKFLYSHISWRAIHAVRRGKDVDRWVLGCWNQWFGQDSWQHRTYPNFPAEPKIASDISFGLRLSNEVPFGISHTCTNDDSNPPEISRVSIPAALLDRGFHMRCLFSIWIKEPTCIVIINSIIKL